MILLDHPPDIVSLSVSEKDKLLLAQWEEIERLRARLKELEGQLKKDSRTSDKAPSSDGPKTPKRTRSQRKPSERKVGGQPGHEYHGLSAVAEPDEVVVWLPDHCQHCQYDLSRQGALDYIARQVFDLPRLGFEVTEHRSACKDCPVCGQLSWGEFPLGVTASVQYGERVQALSVYFSDYQLLPYARQAELFADVFDHRLSVATLQQARIRGARALAPVVEAIRQALVGASVAHFDESGLRVGGQGRWLHVSSTATLTYYRAHAKRGREALEAIGILPAFRGRAIHDSYRSYLSYGHCDHGLCNAHHLRELTFIHEHHEQPWAKAMKDCLVAIKAAVDDAQAQGAARLSAQQLDAFEAEYGQILDQALDQIPERPPPQSPRRGRKKQHPAKNLHDRLRTSQAAVLAFMYDFNVPFDNNQAERDIRMLKVQQKISGGFRTERGAERFCTVRSYISTVRKQGLNVIKALHRAFVGQPWMPGEDLAAA